MKITIGQIYTVPNHENQLISVRAVNGEIEFNEPGIGHGFIHWADPTTGKKLGYCGITWFEQNAILEHNENLRRSI